MLAYGQSKWKNIKALSKFTYFVSLYSIAEKDRIPVLVDTWHWRCVILSYESPYQSDGRNI